MFGHKHFQPVIEAIIKLAEKPPPRSRGTSQPPDSPSTRQGKGPRRSPPTCSRRRSRPLRSRSATTLVDAAHDAGQRRALSYPKATPATKVLLGSAFKAVEHGDRARRRHQDRAAHRRPRHSRPCARSCRRCTSCRARTARRCSRAARRRRSSSRRSAPARTSSTSTRSKAPRKERFMLHYNFPPYSVGETGRMGSPGRREIGHGKLA